MLFYIEKIPHMRSGWHSGEWHGRNKHTVTSTRDYTRKPCHRLPM